MTIPRLGTTTPIKVAKPSQTGPISASECYFLVKLHAAQAVYQGTLWERVKQLVVTSQIVLNHAPFGKEPVTSIRCTRPIKKGRTESVGSATNLIDLIPATMDHVSVSIEFILDRENRLETLASMINTDAFSSAISFAPGAAAIAKTVGGLAQKIIATFLDTDSSKPILQFQGDFNLVGRDQLEEAYYVILGTQDTAFPLPDPLPSLAVHGVQLLADGKPATDWSYVILDVVRVAARTKDLGQGQSWHRKLTEAEVSATAIANDPFVEESKRRAAWTECCEGLKEAHLLLVEDPLYLPKESAAIIQLEYITNRGRIFPPSTQQFRSPPLVTPDFKRLFGVDSLESLETAALRYSKEVEASRETLQAYRVFA